MHTNLLEYELYYWHGISVLPPNKSFDVQKSLLYILGNRKEKSVKKAVMQNYQMQMEKQNRYYHNHIVPFLIEIADPNIVVRFLQTDLYENMIESDISMISSNGFAIFFHFLKSHYSDKQIFGLFQNGLSEIHETACNIFAIHNELIRIDRLLEYQNQKKIKFSYTNKELQQRMRTKGYSVHLPLDNHELFLWATKLQNCLAGYSYNIMHKDTLIYGFFKEDELEFAIEMRDGRLVQKAAKYNTALNSKQEQALQHWFRMKESFSERD